MLVSGETKRIKLRKNETYLRKYIFNGIQTSINDCLNAIFCLSASVLPRR